MPEDQRAIRGYSTYPGDYEVADARDAYRRYGDLLGVSSLAQLHDRLDIEPGSEIGIIHLEAMTELERPVTLAELRANGVSYQSNIVSGRRITLEEVATVFELGGVGVPESVRLAAESGELYE